MKKILVTGSEGFIGKNLVTHLDMDSNFSFYEYNSHSDITLLSEYLKKVDYVIHLAGENRSKKINEFKKNNVDFTKILCEKILTEIKNSKRSIKLIFTSSIHAKDSGPYGQSKLEAEKIIKKYSLNNNFFVNIFRLVGVFGKWCKPNYNSVVATFCHNISRENPIKVDDEKTKLKLVYIDDVVRSLVDSLDKNNNDFYKTINPEYSVTLGELALQIKTFKSSRENLKIDSLGYGFSKVLYSTYLSYLPANQFSYPLNSNIDPRGKFVEVFKSSIFGQVSYLTINADQERGGHYHHTKTEKFIVLKGEVFFRFKNLITNEFVEIKVSSNESRVVDTIPGWVHDIINTSTEEAIIMIWSNEIYDPQNPDTIEQKVLA